MSRMWIVTHLYEMMTQSHEDRTHSCKKMTPFSYSSVSFVGLFSYVPHCITLQHTATHCNTMQHTATGIIQARMWLPVVFIGLFGMFLFDSLSNSFVSFACLFVCVLVGLFSYFPRLFGESLLVFIGLFELTSGWRCSWEQRYHVQHTATHCNTLQYTTRHCNALQHTATHCNTLHHAATHLQLGSLL